MKSIVITSEEARSGCRKEVVIPVSFNDSSPGTHEFISVHGFLTVMVDIPAGTKNGQTIVVPGEGAYKVMIEGETE